MSEGGRPHLRAVAGDKAGEGARPAAASGRPGRGRLLWIALAAAALGGAVGWAFQARETARVQAELDAALGRVASLEQTLAAREARLEGARERATALVDEAAGLAERVRELSGWLAEDAAEASEAAPEPLPSPDEEPVAPPGVAPF